MRGQIQGNGLEMGALHAPFPVPAGVAVSYVDRLSTEELRHHYPELAASDFVHVGIVDDGELLSTVPSSSQDFVIASHVLEHCEDPIGAVASWLRVLRDGGTLYLAVPDKRFTFDRDRPVTPLSHLVLDAEAGPQSSRTSHYLEWAQFVEGCTEEEAAERADQLEASSYSIHFHVWDFEALRDLLGYCLEKSRSGSTLVKMARNRSENLALLRKRGR